MKPGEKMSYEEWLEMRIAFEKDVAKMTELLRTNEFLFWKAPRVEKCSERQRAYLEKSAEIRENDVMGIFE